MQFALKGEASPLPIGGYRMARQEERGEIYLYGIIGGDWFGEGVTARQFADDLKGLRGVKNIDLRINSDGGSVFEGKTMYTLLRDHGADITTHIDGLAASAASFVAMAGDEIRMAEGAFIMIHNAWTIAIGDATEMRRQATLLDSVNETLRDVYVARTGQSAETIAAMMDAETWMQSGEAQELGFADVVVGNLKVVAFVRKPEIYKHTPAALRPRRAAALANLEAARQGCA